MEDGGSYWTDKKKRDSLVAPGNIALIPPGLVHSGSPFQKNSSTYKMIYIDSKLMESVSGQIREKDSGAPEFSKIVMQGAELVQPFQSLYKAILSSPHNMEIESCLYDFVGLVMSKYEASGYSHNPIPQDHSRMTKAAEILASSLYSKLSLGQVAGQMGLSQYHFLRTFKQSYGLSPHAFRTQKRIEAAKNLILEGLPLSQVAYETGFSDQSHLTHRFKDYTGVTPMHYSS